MSKHEYKPADDAADISESVFIVVSFLLKKRQIHDKLRRRLLDRCLWQLTEAEGRHKYDLRFATPDACKLLNAGIKNGLRHEHVWRRSKMVEQLINADPMQIDVILAQAQGCVVTIEEHQRLNDVDRDEDIDGWDRYKKARLKIVDRTKCPNRLISIKKLKELAHGS